MKILVTGVCGFVGSTLTRALLENIPGVEIVGIDNLSRNGSWLNRSTLQALGVKVIHGDIKNRSDVEAIPQTDWVIDAAANPSVLAGVDGVSSSLQLVENNVYGTVNLLEYCKRWKAGFILLSTSRVYSIPGMSNLKMEVKDDAFTPSSGQQFPAGISLKGVSEIYSTTPPVSIYGSSKVVSEHLALEYGETFGFPVWINRCGVMAGAGQFGHPAQGIFAFWIHSFREKQPLQYIGFGGNGFQVRDCLNPKDLVSLLQKQFAEPLPSDKPRTVNISGGVENSMSLKQLTGWCEKKFGPNNIAASNTHRAFDIPWIVLDPSEAERVWGWKPATSIDSVLSEIADFAAANSNWLSISREK
jgi:CDP-paratose 2-epimerase